MTQLQNLMNEISEWSDATFGNGQRNPAIVYHLKKELDELIDCFHISAVDSPKNRMLRMEFADCFMLLLDSAHHACFSANDILEAVREKLEINKNREWDKPDENGVVEHIEDKLTKEEYLKQVENSKYEVTETTSPYDKSFSKK